MTVALRISSQLLNLGCIQGFNQNVRSVSGPTVFEYYGYHTVSVSEDSFAQIYNTLQLVVIFTVKSSHIISKHYNITVDHLDSPSHITWVCGFSENCINTSNMGNHIVIV